ncbi:sulfite exporter TauE/SafE family protein [Camelimonas sp. ID_303_24]
MTLTLLEGILGVGAGALVGFTLGLVGGGGSILATPLLVYLVGVANPHVAIGTSAVVVAANAFVNLLNHARAGNVKWRCAAVFSAAGTAGAAAGAALGKSIGGASLLGLFAALMLAVGVMMLRGRADGGEPTVRLNRNNFPKLVATGAGAGALSGFFGIGGGFLIAPGLVAATGMPLVFAIGSSLVAVTAFGLTTAISYAASGLVDWRLAALFIGGGVLGGLPGAWAARRLAASRGALNRLFALIIIAVATFMLARASGLH